MLKQIQYFQAVVRCGSFTEAAEACYISQSAISQQIQTLEKELGIKLLERRNRTFSVTPAGEYFYKKSLQWVDDYETMCRETVRIARGADPQLRIGYLRCYSGRELRQAIAEFAKAYPDIGIHLINGNHEELYDELRQGKVDLVLSDQRRAFSDEYVNFILATSECFIEIAEHSPLAGRESADTRELKDIPCILVASQSQQENEQNYYHDIVRIRGDFLFAETLEEARLMVIGGKGFMPVEGRRQAAQSADNLQQILLLRKGRPIKRNYCAFWKADNSGYYIEEFAELLKASFSAEE